VIKTSIVRSLACTLALLVGIGAIASQAEQDPQRDSTFKVNVKLVSIFATVTDAHGAPVVDLNKDDFSLAEDGVPQKIAVFDQQSELPLSIVLAVDASGSVRKDIKVELDSARKFVAATLRKKDVLALYQFSETVQELVRFTGDLSRIDRGIKNVRVGAATALYDAIYLGSNALAPREGRKVMVLITDGGDTVSAVKYPEAVRAAQQADTLVYSIIIVPIASNAGRNTGGEHALIQLSHDTGGKHYFADSPKSLDEAFQQISRELRTQYLLGYYPAQRLADSDFRRITVGVKGGSETKTSDGDDDPVETAERGYRIRHRAGYYTSKQN
jgi:Ca-activated chloride channel family protein